MCFVKVINEIIRGLDNVLVCLDDVIVHDLSPAEHVGTISALFERLRKYNLKTFSVQDSARRY